MRRTPALIVGGGPAGAAAAITLARAGAMPVLVERSAGERDVVCGGFLGWDAIAALKRLGLDPASLGAKPIHRLRLMAGERMVEARLPKAAAGLSRRRLDATLLRLAEESGATVLCGRAARSIEDRCVRLDDGEEWEARAIFIATGKHELRGAAREVGRRAVSVGLRSALRATPALQQALAGTIELHLFDGGYAGLLVQEDGTVNCCLSVETERMASGRDALLAELAEEAPRLAERIEGAELEWEAVAGVPYGWRALETEAGLYRVGDQAAVIASLAGDGVAVALTSGVAAGQACLTGDGPGARAYQREFAGRARAPLAIAEALRGMAERPLRRQALMQLAKIPGLAAAAARLTRIG